MERFNPVASFNIKSLLIEFKQSATLESENGIIFTAGSYQTYVHEYAHAIVYFSTVHFLTQFTFYQFALNRIAEQISNESVVTLPINFSTNEDWAMLEGIERLSGDGKNTSPKIIDTMDYIKLAPIIHSKAGSLNFEIPVIKFADSTEYVLGEICINESIAFFVESAFQGSDVTLPDFPYQSSRLVSEKILERRLPNKDLCLICYYSLMDLNPGMEFIQILYYIKKLKPDQTEYAKLKDYLYERYLKKGDELICKGCFHDLNELVKNSKQSTYYKEMKFLLGQFEAAREHFLRNKEPVFMDIFDISNKSSDEKVNSVNNWAKIISPPMIMDQNTLAGKGFTQTGPDLFPDAKNAYLLLQGIKYLCGILSHKSLSKCPYFDYCNHDKNNEYDCYSAPWEKANLSPTCQIGFAAAFLGLKGKVVS